MTYEHRPGGYPASPDVDVGVPELCEKCSRDCLEPCEAFKRLETIMKHRLKLVDEITGYDNPFRGGGWVKFTTSHGDQLEIWFNDLWKILEDGGP